jgi:hypothetical protein
MDIVLLIVSQTLLWWGQPPILNPKKQQTLFFHEKVGVKPPYVSLFVQTPTPCVIRVIPVSSRLWPQWPHLIAEGGLVQEHDRHWNS